MGQAVKGAAAPYDLSRWIHVGRAGLRDDPQVRLQAALFASLLLHVLAVVLFTGWTVPDSNRSRDSDLTVELVNVRTASAPDKADIRAQHNLDGGGNTDADRRVKTPLPATRPAPAPDIAHTMRRAEPREADPTRVMVQSRQPAPAVVAPEARPRTDPQPDAPPAPSAADIMNSSREMLQLQGQISRSLEEYNKRPRRTFIGARAREYRFARYVDDWRLKVERVGELNYPASARGVYGNVLVTVEIRADGQLAKVEINRSSGHKVLDQAAINIVSLAAPFAAFPADIAADTDVLSITRTWTFTRADRFQAD